MTDTSTTGRDVRPAELHGQITEGDAALVESEAWRAMLDTAARFHTYSLNNVLLIAMQAPHATQVAGFRTWQSLGRQVRKGERGIAILAPCTYRPKRATTTATAEAGATAQAATDQPTDNDSSGGQASPSAGRKQVRGFRVVHVFDIAQTDGQDLPQVRPAPVPGSAPAGLWDGPAAQAAEHGYTLQRGDCGRAQGYTDPGSRTVRVRADVDDAQAVLTLAHELAHIECGHVADLPTYATCRGRCEVAAESVSYVVAAAAGLDASAYTLAYVAGWAGGDLAVVRQAAQTVNTAAHTILDRPDSTDSASGTGGTGGTGPGETRVDEQLAA